MKNNFYLKTMTDKELIICMMEESIDALKTNIEKMEHLGFDMTLEKDLLIAREITLKNYKEEN